MQLCDLQDEILARILGILGTRDLAAATVASKYIAVNILPNYPIWKEQFIRRWHHINFNLRQEDEEIDLVLNGHLRRLFPAEYSESRMYQILTHGIRPVPSSMNIYSPHDYTNHSRLNFVNASAEDEMANEFPERVRDFAYVGQTLGDNRTVPANCPFRKKFHIAVFRRHASNSNRRLYHVGLVTGGYFELTISPETIAIEANRHGQRDTVAIGVAAFGMQRGNTMPGWHRLGVSNPVSIGYHGDDGQLFVNSNVGQPFGPHFSVGDTVGCGLHRNPTFFSTRTRLLFTLNGQEIPLPGGRLPPLQRDMYPVIGIDCLNIISVNFGQRPFLYDTIVDELFELMDDLNASPLRDIYWQAINDDLMFPQVDESFQAHDMDDFPMQLGPDIAQFTQYLVRE